MANLLTDYIEGNNETIPIAPDIQFLQASASASSTELQNWERNLGETTHISEADFAVLREEYE